MDRNERREQWIVPKVLRGRMIEVAREFRKTPTASEAILWEALRSNRISGVKFRRQQPIGPFVVDFYAPTKRLVVEIDGPIHETQSDADRERQRIVESLGIRFVRLPTDLVENHLPEALGLIRQKIDVVGDAPSIPPPLSPTRGERGKTEEGAEAASDSSLLVVPLSPLVGERGRGG